MPTKSSNPYSDLVSIMRDQGSVNNPPSIQLAEVISVPPNLIIKFGDLELDKDNLLIADYLLRDYKRAYYAEGVMHAKYDENFATTSSVCDGGLYASSHTHDVLNMNYTTTKDNFSIHGDGNDPIENDGSAQDKYFYFKDTLKKGDLLAVMPTQDMQTYLIIGRMVRL